MSRRPLPSRAPVPGALWSSRRGFLAAAGSACAVLGGAGRGGVPVARAEAVAPQPFKISLSQRSLRQEFAAGRLDPLDFPRVASRLGLDAVEYEGKLYAAKLRDKRYLGELKRRAAGEGVWSKLILIEAGAGLGAPDSKSRRRAADRLEPWLEAAAFLGCHAVCLQVASQGSEDDQANWVSDGLRRLCKLGDPLGIDVLVENHAGFSAKGSWLAEVLQAVGHPRCGSRPDFGSFALGGGREYDRYQGVRELMPFARAVGARAHDFDARGEETRTNYAQMLKVVLDAGYHGHVAIEYAGDRLGEQTGIARTLELLERVRARFAPRAGQPG